MSKEWFILKIFPTYKPDWSDALTKVWELNDRFRKQLEELAEDDNNFFMHYVDTSVSEGPHFKFFVKLPKNKAKFEEWVNEHKQDKNIKDITIHYDDDNQTFIEGTIAREVFERVKQLDKCSQLNELKALLTNDASYQFLSENVGKHYLKNMLKMTYSEEEYFNNL